MISRRLIRIKVAQELYSHIQSCETNVERTKKELITSTAKCYQLYLLLMRLIVDVQQYAQKRIEIRLSKHRPTEDELNPNRRFVENPVVCAMADSGELEKALGKISWGDHQVMVKGLYNALIDSDFYKTYMSKDEVTFSDHRKFVINFLQKFIEDNEEIENHVEELSIFWLDNIEYALGFVIQTVGEMKADNLTLNINEPFQNDDDREYAITLLEKSILNKDKYLKVIDEVTKNWDLERIALMDKVLMVEAISEMVEFDSIPVKATLNEFIEIAKYYSTPQSATFINGVLDQVSEIMKNDIIKTGRGLL